jgi:glycosyltransferase involved in cell wall biosynthesis
MSGTLLETRPDRETPRVSCVMPTRNRPEFALQAIRYFERQDYPRAELVVVDDGFEKLPAALPEDGRVRYLQLPSGLSLGAKRNFGCSQARGAILVQWDDAICPIVA